MFWLKTVKLSKKPQKPDLLATMARVGGEDEGAWAGAWSIVAEILGFFSFLNSFTVFNQNIGFYWALQRFSYISLENHKILLLFIRNQCPKVQSAIQPANIDTQSSTDLSVCFRLFP